MSSECDAFYMFVNCLQNTNSTAKIIRVLFKMVLFHLYYNIVNIFIIVVTLSDMTKRSLSVLMA